MSVNQKQSKSFQPISHLKQKVLHKHQRNYCQTHQEKTLNFYHLHIDKIHTIQRWFKSWISTQNRITKTTILNKIAKREALMKENQLLQEEFNKVQEARAVLMNIDQQSYIEQSIEQITTKLKKVINGTLDNAEKLAYNNGQAKYLLSESKGYMEGCEELEGEVEGLRFEFDSYKARRGEWETKLEELQTMIAQQSSKSDELSAKLTAMEIKRHETRATACEQISISNQRY